MRKMIMLTALAASLAWVVAAGAASAAVTTVNCAPFGADDLQAKITAAAPGDTLSIKGTCTGNFVIAKNLTVQAGAPGATLNGGGASNTLYVPGSTVTISNLTITGGGGLADFGGGIAVESGASVNLVNATVRGNTSNICGGGIEVENSTLNLVNSTVSGNTTQFCGGGITSFFSTLTVNGSTVSGDNVSDPNNSDGGGIEVFGSTATLTSSTVTGNTSGNNGAGIGQEGTGSTLALISSTVSWNTAINSGAGIGNYGGDLTLTNSSVDHNTGGSGAGIFNDSGFQDATLTIDNSNVSFNRDMHSESFFGGGGIFNFAEGGNTASLVATGLTMIGNTCGGNGGAIGNGTLDGASPAVATISHSRIGPPNGQNPNQAVFGGGISNDGTFGPASVTLQPGTIVAHNQASNDGGGIYSTGTNASLSIAPGVVFLANTPDDAS
jgi:hypothetical protein